MSADTSNPIKSIIIKGPTGRMYAIPIEDLEARYAHTLDDTKQRKLDALVSRSRSTDRAVEGFYHDVAPTVASECLG